MKEDYRDDWDDEEEIDRGLMYRYKQRLENELSPESERLNKSYSHDYVTFKQEQTGKFHLLFEYLCRKAHKLLKVKIKEKDREKLRVFLRLAHFDISAESVYSLTYIFCLIALIGSVVATVILGNVYVILVGIILVIFLLFYIPSYPKTTFIKWRAKASDQLVLAVMYMVIQMERISNLELAVEFVARHIAPPVSLDFMKVLWDVESKVYSSVSQSLEEYIKTWKGWNDDFIEAVHLVQFSLQQKNDTERRRTLHRATIVVLEGTHQHMLKYAHSLQGPMQALHMLGVVLPVMALVMLPLIGAFMGAKIKWFHLVILYNLFFPILVYSLGKDMLQKRPAGTSGGDSYTYMLAKYHKPYINIGKLKLRIPPALFGVIIFFVVAIPGLLYFFSLTVAAYSGSLPNQEIMFSTYSLLFTLDLILAAGLGVGMYFYYSVHYLIKIKHKIERIEAEFPSGVFQLANRIKEKVPAEVAFEKVARSIRKSDIGEMFWLIDYNLKKQGTDLEDAIFNEKYGAMAYYPSGIIKSAMSVLVDAAKKGPVSAAKSLFSVSKYLTSLKRVNDRLQDLLADTTSSMRMQVAMFIPLITGLVVGLNMLITKILRNLGTVLSDLPVQGGESAQMNLGTDLLSIFQFEHMIPAFVAALVVGIYIIQIVCLISYLVNGINKGYDTIEMKYLIGRNLFIAVPFFCIVSAITSIMLTNIVNVMPTVGV